MPTVLLIRHGENDFIKSQKLAGRMHGVHLNENGQQQARVLGEVLKDKGLKAIYSSPLDRALETARPIADACGLKLETRWGLEESDLGDWEGKSLKRLKRSKLWKQLQEQPSRFQFPGGESMAEQQMRLVGELDELLARHKEKDVFACVGHADPIKLLAAYHLGLPMDLFQRLHVSPASVTTLHFESGGVRLLNLNQTFS